MTDNILKPCMFYLEDKISNDEKMYVFLSICNMLDFNITSMATTSMLYASYGVFEGKPLDSKDIEGFLEDNACATSCREIYERFNTYNLKENACYICDLCDGCYTNQNEKYELAFLKGFLEKFLKNDNIQFSLIEEESLNSYRKLGSDYAIGTYPVIQLCKLFYIYLKTKNNISMTKEEISKDFFAYLKDKQDIDTNPEIKNDIYQSAIDIFIADIYRADIKDSARLFRDIDANNRLNRSDGANYITQNKPKVNIKPNAKPRKKKIVSDDNIQQSIVDFIDINNSSGTDAATTSTPGLPSVEEIQAIANEKIIKSTINILENNEKKDELNLEIISLIQDNFYHIVDDNVSLEMFLPVLKKESLYFD